MGRRMFWSGGDGFRNKSSQVGSLLFSGLSVHNSSILVDFSNSLIYILENSVFALRDRPSDRPFLGKNHQWVSQFVTLPS